MSIHDVRDREVIKEYYLFLYNLVIEKNYAHSSQLTSEERKYCERLLSYNQLYKPNELYLSLIEDILEESIRQKRNASSKLDKNKIFVYR